MHNNASFMCVYPCWCAHVGFVFLPFAFSRVSVIIMHFVVICVSIQHKSAYLATELRKCMSVKKLTRMRTRLCDAVFSHISFFVVVVFLS